MDGKAVLAEIEQDAELKRIPVAILTSSPSEKDVAESYRLGANCYVVKPIDFKSFQSIVRGIENFWFGIVKLPQSQRGEMPASFTVGLRARRWRIARCVPPRGRS